MSAGNERERTAGGVLGRAVGKAKEVLGQATENHDLAREAEHRADRLDPKEAR